ncbi:hypothetical protein OLMES_2497 [Oleiphilus messinensis]|uniref:Uncharacterized protein n=1 Tax=Oleiphilus messinensis TaxID=141451 RepID=A0A1Y0I9W4_9GAMM|nr:hypothetical protein [Oleiphilus messinensis]ARU56556.1 hypothetical protein OLMES_2497 [Oleiphilus messinensis]
MPYTVNCNQGKTQRFKRTVLFPLSSVFLLVLSSFTFASEKAETETLVTHQTYRSCSVIASEMLTTVQLHQKGIPVDTLRTTLPGLTENGLNRLSLLYKKIDSQGALAVYSLANSQYSRCAKSVFDRQGKPKPQEPDYLFYFCSGENKIRHEIILARMVNAPMQDLIRQLPQGRKALAPYIYNIVKEKDLKAAYDFSATELKRCLNQ